VAMAISHVSSAEFFVGVSDYVGDREDKLEY